MFRIRNNIGDFLMKTCSSCHFVRRVAVTNLWVYPACENKAIPFPHREVSPSSKACAMYAERERKTTIDEQPINRKAKDSDTPADLGSWGNDSLFLDISEDTACETA